MDMHIYSNEEFENLQKMRAFKKAFECAETKNEPSGLLGRTHASRSRVIKNYIYYDEPVKIMWH